MSRYERAKAELERALVGESPKPAQLRLVVEPVRYAAITVMQPYAWLIAHAAEWPEHVPGKTIENRSRPTNHRGPVLIHVSRRWERVGERLAELRRLGLVGGVCPEPSLEQMQAQRGQVIAAGELVGCRRVGDRDPHPWAIAGSWGWELEDVELVRPFGLRGNTGLWYAPPNITVHKLMRLLELGGLPCVAGLGLQCDPTTGRASTRVASLGEALRTVRRAGVVHRDYVVEIDGAPMTAGELMARAAEEYGDPGFAAWVRRYASDGCARATPPAVAARGPLACSCEAECGGLHG